MTNMKKQALNAKTSQKTIVQFFARQTLDKERSKSEVEALVKCPVCNVMVPENRINYHLDNQCHLVTSGKERLTDITKPGSSREHGHVAESSQSPANPDGPSTEQDVNFRDTVAVKKHQKTPCNRQTHDDKLNKLAESFSKHANETTCTSKKNNLTTSPKEIDSSPRSHTRTAGSIERPLSQTKYTKNLNTRSDFGKKSRYGVEECNTGGAGIVKTARRKLSLSFNDGHSCSEEKNDVATCTKSRPSMSFLKTHQRCQDNFDSNSDDDFVSSNKKHSRITSSSTERMSTSGAVLRLPLVTSCTKSSNKDRNGQLAMRDSSSDDSDFVCSSLNRSIQPINGKRNRAETERKESPINNSARSPAIRKRVRRDDLLGNTLANVQTDHVRTELSSLVDCITSNRIGSSKKDDNSRDDFNLITSSSLTGKTVAPSSSNRNTVFNSPSRNNASTSRTSTKNDDKSRGDFNLIPSSSLTGKDATSSSSIRNASFNSTNSNNASTSSASNKKVKSGFRKYASFQSPIKNSVSPDSKSTTLSQRALVSSPSKFRRRRPIVVVTPESRAKAKIRKSEKAKLKLSKYDTTAGIADFSSPVKSQTEIADPVVSPRSKAFLRKIPSCFDDLKQAIVATKVPVPFKDLWLSPRPTAASVVVPYSPTITTNRDPERNQSQEKEYLMYFIRNFLDILQCVLDEEDDRILFNNDDLTVIRRFYMLSAGAQELYVRLFTRKHKWLLGEKLSYPEISSDLKPALLELCNTGFLEDGDNLSDLKTLLAILPAPRVKKLAKHLNLKVVSNKPETVSLIMDQCRTQPTIFSRLRNDSSTKGVVIKKAKELLEECYRLLDEPRKIFLRVMMLFSLTQTVDDSRQDEQPVQMTTVVMVNIGKLVFPSFDVLRQARIFRNRDDLIRYETAHSLESDILLAIEEKDWDAATLLCTVARQSHSELVSQENIIGHDSSLPNFLKKFTAGHLYTRCLGHRVELLQKIKQYQDAVDQLLELLEQTYYCQRYRGHWMERLALNYDQHLKMPIKALEVIARGLEDTTITTDHKLCLYLRLQKLLKRKATRDIIEGLIENIPEFTFPETPEVYCQGRIVPFPVPGNKTAFELDVPSVTSGQSDVIICSVEEVALDHYMNNGFTDGVHGEGAALVTIFSLLFWDLIYKSGIPDAFRSAYQGFPLDLVTNDFYKNRKAEIDEHLRTIQNSTVEELAVQVDTCWRNHENETSLVSWNLYGSSSRAQALVKCIGISHLVSICERFCHNYRHYRSGVPDLTIWNSQTLEWKMIEVKGPGDRLSNKQIEWLEFLRTIGVSAEVCHVQATGAKRLTKLARSKSPRKKGGSPGLQVSGVLQE